MITLADGSTHDPFELLCELVSEAGLRMTFDRSRDITLCACCGRRSPRPTKANGYAVGWTLRAAGWPDRDCRKVCSIACQADSLLRFLVREGPLSDRLLVGDVCPPVAGRERGQQ